MSPPSKGSARRVILAGAATLLVAAVMAVAGSGLAPVDERSPYATAMLALELARTPADVLAAAGPPAHEARAVLARVIWIDFAFLVLYPLLSLAIVAFLTRNRAWRGVAVALALVMAAGDALENRALLGLLGLATSDAPRATSLVAGAMLWTTVKWASLFAAALVTAVLLWARGGVARVPAVVPLASAAAGIVGLAAPAHRPLVEIAGVYGIAATWVMVIVMAIAALRATPRRRKR